MAFLEIKNVRVAGVSAGVPKKIIRNADVAYRLSEDYDNMDFVNSTGVSEFRFSTDLTTSDLCYAAAERLIEDLNWKKEEIDAIIVVTQTPDFIVPATSCILQDRLGLSKECLAEDISLGCSGWVYGLVTLSALLQNGSIKKALLMAGDARPQVEISEQSWNHLFGMAGTVTAIEYQASFESMLCHVGTDGSSYDAIIIPYGGCRNPFTPKAFIEEEIDGKKYNGLQSRMKGMDVFSFGISVAPKSVRKLASKYNYNFADSDYFVFHQSNKKMLEMIAKKLKLPREKVPDGLKFFGNTSSASIPLAIVTELGDALKSGRHSLTCCGFGVGLSWGTVKFVVDDLIISKLVEL